MATGMRSKKQDYQFALEGVGYAQTILRNYATQLEDIIHSLNDPEVMGGETGKEYCKRLSEAVDVVKATIDKFNKFADAVSKKCEENGAFLNGSVMDDFNELQKQFAAKAAEIRTTKVQSKA